MHTANLRNLITACILSLAIICTASGDVIVVNAGESIQAAINGANDGDEIEVAPGTYYEAINFNGKSVYLYSSGGPDVTTIDANGAYHAVQCVSGEDANTVLDGFTITGGDTSGDPLRGGGGGMYNESSSPTVTNCTFRGNTAGNYGGGGMFNYNASGTVSNCIFAGNIASGFGGGMSNFEYSSPAVTNCNFSGNWASKGGGMGNWYNANPTVTNCTFNDNTAFSGGAMYNYVYSSPTVINCKFSGNEADEGGVGMYNYEYSSPTVTNCIFNGNTSSYAGSGGIDNWNNSNPTVTNCTFSFNFALFGGMYNFNSSPTVTNCILWNGGYEISNNGGSTITVTYSDVQGGWPGEGNIDADPLFVFVEVGDLRLLSDSPCIDAGDNNSVSSDSVDLDGDGNTTELIPYDLNGEPRLWDGDGDGYDMVDMGALEYGELRVHNKTQNASYISIQRAINEGNNGDEIEVEPGSYSKQTIDFKGKGVRLYSSHGPEVTTINGKGNYRVIQCVSGENADTVLEGFTITGGNAVSGGGMYNSGSSPRVTNCTFSGNEAIEGAGMNNMNSSPMVINCTFNGNSAAQWGGGMYNSGGSPVVTNCTFAGNWSVSGGGMYNHLNSSPKVTNCILWGDTPDEIYNDGSKTIVTYSDVQGGIDQSWFGTSCIDANPCFMDVSNPDQNLWNLRLKPDSPCIDAGDTRVVYLPLDMDGYPRAVDDPYTHNTGRAISTSLNAVDMGTYEFQPCRTVGDVNCDGVVDFRDVAIICANWLSGIGP